MFGFYGYYFDWLRDQLMVTYDCAAWAGIYAQPAVITARLVDLDMTRRQTNGPLRADLDTLPALRAVSLIDGNHTNTPSISAAILYDR